MLARPPHLIEAPAAPSDVRACVARPCRSGHDSRRARRAASGGTPDSLRLVGQIQPEVTAALDSIGLTGDPKFAVGRPQKGSPYAYHVAAHFDGASGTGKRLEVRPCDLRFVKQ
jgi:hypothetical protein